ncbi:hypothetical protein RIF29_14802 [Crotalaria pallida]|uniref:Uncharacterized protein n=1 Tax=Crotalaria pallida TaxID=3830 RepID=A0AAN9FE28_CROPI
MADATTPVEGGDSSLNAAIEDIFRTDDDIDEHANVDIRTPSLLENVSHAFDGEEPNEVHCTNIAAVNETDVEMGKGDNEANEDGGNRLMNLCHLLIFEGFIHGRLSRGEKVFSDHNLQHQQKIQHQVSKLEIQHQRLFVEIQSGLSTIKEKQASIDALKRNLANQEAQLTDLVSITKEAHDQQVTLSKRASTLLLKCQDVVNLLASTRTSYEANLRMKKNFVKRWANFHKFL